MKNLFAGALAFGGTVLAGYIATKKLLFSDDQEEEDWEEYEEYEEEGYDAIGYIGIDETEQPEQVIYLFDQLAFWIGLKYVCSFVTIMSLYIGLYSVISN